MHGSLGDSPIIGDWKTGWFERAQTMHWFRVIIVFCEQRLRRKVNRSVQCPPLGIISHESKAYERCALQKRKGRHEKFH